MVINIGTSVAVAITMSAFTATTPVKPKQQLPIVKGKALVASRWELI
jgi:hypothetical protein